MVILTFLESSILVIDVFSQPNSGHVDVSRQPTITRVLAFEADLKLKKSSAEFFTPFALLRGSISLIYQFFSNHGRVPLKGLSTLKITCSRFKGYGLLIWPLIFIFHFGETPENGRDSGQKMSTPVTKSL